MIENICASCRPSLITQWSPCSAKFVDIASRSEIAVMAAESCRDSIKRFASPNREVCRRFWTHSQLRASCRKPGHVAHHEMVVLQVSGPGIAKAPCPENPGRICQHRGKPPEMKSNLSASHQRRRLSQEVVSVYQSGWFPREACWQPVPHRYSGRGADGMAQFRPDERQQVHT